MRTRFEARLSAAESIALNAAMRANGCENVAEYLRCKAREDVPATLSTEPAGEEKMLFHVEYSGKPRFVAIGPDGHGAIRTLHGVREVDVIHFVVQAGEVCLLGDWTPQRAAMLRAVQAKYHEIMR